MGQFRHAAILRPMDSTTPLSRVGLPTGAHSWSSYFVVFVSLRASVIPVPRRSPDRRLSDARREDGEQPRSGPARVPTQERGDEIDDGQERGDEIDNGQERGDEAGDKQGYEDATANSRSLETRKDIDN